MTTTRISLDELVSDIDDYLQETDAEYVAALAERVCGGKSVAMSDGETIRRDGIKHSFNSVVQDIVDAISEMEPKDAAKLATELLTSDFEVDEDGAILARTHDDTPAP